MAGLWRNQPGTREGKFPVLLRRDGTRPDWPYFVLGARDPAAPAALRAYADAAERLGFDSQFVSDIRQEATMFEEYRTTEGPGDPDAKPHRKDDPDALSFPGSLVEYRRKIKSGILARISKHFSLLLD